MEYTKEYSELIGEKKLKIKMQANIESEDLSEKELQEILSTFADASHNFYIEYGKKLKDNSI